MSYFLLMLACLQKSHHVVPADRGRISNRVKHLRRAAGGIVRSCAGSPHLDAFGGDDNMGPTSHLQLRDDLAHRGVGQRTAQQVGVQQNRPFQHQAMP
eukprot:541882-Lingulodinium_polyedra.AAC.1